MAQTVKTERFAGLLAARPWLYRDGNYREWPIDAGPRSMPSLIPGFLTTCSTDSGSAHKLEVASGYTQKTYQNHDGRFVHVKHVHPAF